MRWDEDGSATAWGQWAFFAEFLVVMGLFERGVEGCPMADGRPNAPAVADVLGTRLLSILDGQRRYARATGLRGDEAAPKILGMNKIVSDESLRRALAHRAPSCDHDAIVTDPRIESLGRLQQLLGWVIPTPIIG